MPETNVNTKNKQIIFFIVKLMDNNPMFWLKLHIFIIILILNGLASKNYDIGLTFKAIKTKCNDHMLEPNCTFPSMFWTKLRIVINIFINSQQIASQLYKVVLIFWDDQNKGK